MNKLSRGSFIFTGEKAKQNVIMTVLRGRVIPQQYFIVR